MCEMKTIAREDYALGKTRLHSSRWNRLVSTKFHSSNTDFFLGRIWIHLDWCLGHLAKKLRLTFKF